MPKPAKFEHGNLLSKEEYKKRLNEYYKEKELKNRANQYHHVKRKAIDTTLFYKVKNTAKLKFLWPSTEAKAWVVREYYNRGGTLKENKSNSTLTFPSGQTVSVEENIAFEEGRLFFNTENSNLYIAEEKTNERKIVERRGDAKEGDLWIHPNTGNLHMKVGDKWITVNDPNKLPKTNRQKVHKNLSTAFAEKRKKEETYEKKIIIKEKPKITRGQFLYKYKSPQNFYSWQDLAREHINDKYRNDQFIFNAPAYYLKDELCNSLINTNINNLVLDNKPNIISPNFFVLHSNKIDQVKYSYVQCNHPPIHTKTGTKNIKFDIYVNFVIEPKKIYSFAFNWKDLTLFRFLQFTKAEDEIFQKQFLMIINLILLMNQQPDIITEEYIPSKVIPLPKKYKAQSPIKPSAISWVGKDFTTRIVKLKPKIDEKDFVISGQTRKVKPHWRRGHWHTVLKGKNRKERKMRWYQPVFVVGQVT